MKQSIRIYVGCKMLNCLILHGSPRGLGNTDKVLIEMTRLFRENSVSCDVVYLKELTIKPCVGCDFCIKNAKCIFIDDFSRILDKLINCDIIVIGTPVYFGGVTSHLKLFIDRLQLLYNNRSLINNEKLMYFILVAAEHKPEVFKPLLLGLRYISHTLHVSSVEKVLINGHYSIGNLDDLLMNYDLEGLVIDGVKRRL